jgi:iron complex outermembrane receptor protein
MKKPTLRIFPAAALCLMAGAAWGSEPNDTQTETTHVEKPAQLDKVTVESDETLLRIIPAGRHEIPENLDASGKSETGDLLRNAVGIAGSRMGGHGIDLFIRGQKATQLNVLLDGAAIHGACPNRMDPPTSFANLLSFDEVTIIKGVQSLQYGAGGSGGTVLFERHSDQAPLGTHGQVAFKTTNNGLNADLSFDVSHVTEKAWLRAFGGAKDADNYTDGAGREWRTGYRSHHWGLVAGMRLRHNQSLEFNYDHSNTFDALFPGAGMDSPRDDASTARVKYRIDNPVSGIHNLRIEAYRSQVDHLMDNYSLRENNGMKMASPAESDTDGLRILADAKDMAGWDLTWGLEQKKTERFASLGNPMMQRIIAWTWPRVSTELSGAFVDGRRAVTARTTLVAGLRYDHVNAGAAWLHTPPPNAPMNTPAAIYQRVHGQSGASVSENNPGGLLRIEQTLDSGLFWFADFNQTVRTADATERYFAKPDWVGNPQIKPEKHRQFDTGANWEHGNSSFSFNLYYDDIENYILRDWVHNTMTYRNIEAHIYGGEISLSLLPSATWQLSAAASWTFGKNETDGRYLPQIPAHEGKISLEKHRNHWLYGLRFNFSARQNRIDPQSGLDVIPTPGWSTWDTFAQYKINQHWQLDAGIDNLLDREYAQHLNRKDALGNVALVNEPGRTLWGRILYRF